MRHDDRRGAGYWDEADLEVLSFGFACALREYFRRCLEREELRQCGKRSRGADRFQEGAAGCVLRKHRAHDRRGDHALVALLVAAGCGIITAPSCVVMLALAGMAAA